jgi:hypothetical protein
MKPTDKNQHTPTPWRTYEEDNLIVCFGEGDSICDCAPGSPFIKMPTAMANAAFIVKAVNSHEILIAALKDILNASNDPYEIAKNALRKVQS